MVMQIDPEPKRTGVSKLNIFARHETFHPRFGWLRKGFERAAKNPEIFLQDDAPVQLGVGKNMVRSIRYWCHAFKLLKDDQPTPLGERLLGQEGWDQYLEDPASLWLLHWTLIEQPCQATTWDFAFNNFRLIEFTVEDLFYQLCEYRDRESSRTVDSSLRKDVSCLLRMYVEQSAKSLISEESLDCPFTQLGLIHTAGDSRHYTFRLGYKPTLPSEVIVYACLRYLQHSPVNRVPLAQLLYDSGSPGLVFRLTESVLSDAIETVARYQDLGITDAAGKLEFFFTGEASEQAKTILHHYYKTR
jgi:hypothetical protein